MRPSCTMPRTAVGRKPPEAKAATRIPPSHTVRLEPRRGELAHAKGSAPPLSLANMSSDASQRPGRDCSASAIRPTNPSSDATAMRASQSVVQTASRSCTMSFGAAASVANGPPVSVVVALGRAGQPSSTLDSSWGSCFACGERRRKRIFASGPESGCAAMIASVRLARVSSTCTHWPAPLQPAAVVRLQCGSFSSAGAGRPGNGIPAAPFAVPCRVGPSADRARKVDERGVVPSARWRLLGRRHASVPFAQHVRRVPASPHHAAQPLIQRWRAWVCPLTAARQIAKVGVVLQVDSVRRAT
eukprot:scaffold55227_cov58-Phaeocystis_antarctica.AAC.2